MKYFLCQIFRAIEQQDWRGSPILGVSRGIARDLKQSFQHLSNPHEVI